MSALKWPFCWQGPTFSRSVHSLVAFQLLNSLSPTSFLFSSSSCLRRAVVYWQNTQSRWKVDRKRHQKKLRFARSTCSWDGAVSPTCSFRSLWRRLLHASSKILWLVNVSSFFLMEGCSSIHVPTLNLAQTASNCHPEPPSHLNHSGISFHAHCTFLALRRFRSVALFTTPDLHFLLFPLHSIFLAELVGSWSWNTLGLGCLFKKYCLRHLQTIYSIWSIWSIWSIKRTPQYFPFDFLEFFQQESQHSGWYFPIWDTKRPSIAHCPVMKILN